MMPRMTLLLLLTIAVGSGGCTPTGGSSSGTKDPIGAFSDDVDPALAGRPFVENELLVQAYPGAAREKLDTLYADQGMSVIASAPEIDLEVLLLSDGDPETRAEALIDSGLIENVQKNHIFEVTEVPNDPFFATQSYLERIGAQSAWDTVTGSENVLIAVLDTGIESEHPDLKSKIASGVNIWDDNSDLSDVIGHGTSVAGVAAAITDNRTGVAGISWQSELLVVKVSAEDGSSTARHIAAGILWAVSNGAKVINVSFAPLQSSSIVQSAAEFAYHRGSLVVISSGNSGELYDALGYEEAIFVGALGTSDRIASFSDRGPYVDLVAPGSGIRSTGVDAGYRLASGTSFSAPIVSGVAALVWSVNPEFRPTTIRETLEQTAKDLGARGYDETYGYGMVDAATAVAVALEVINELDETPPTASIESPEDGASQSRRFRVNVDASDDDVVADVILSIDGLVYATDSRSPYSFTVDPDEFAEGEHEVTATAIDVSGNVSDFAVVILNFGVEGGGGNLSGITFESPLAGSRVSGDVSIRTRVEDEDGLVSVEWFVDGVSQVVDVVSGNSATVTYRWRSDDYGKGSHTITLVVMDGAGELSSGDLILIRQ